MQAFNNDQELKTILLTRYKAHESADQFVQEKYWGGRCVIQCAARTRRNPYQALESEFFIPYLTSWLGDQILEMLNSDDAKEFPTEWANAIPVGANLTKIFDQFAEWMLIGDEFGLVNITTEPSIRKMGELFARANAGDEPSNADWNAATLYARNAFAASNSPVVTRSTWAAQAIQSVRIVDFLRTTQMHPALTLTEPHRIHPINETPWAAQAIRSANDAWVASTNAPFNRRFLWAARASEKLIELLKHAA
jgi:hypothetical protein